MKYKNSLLNVVDDGAPQKTVPEYTPNTEYDFFRANSTTDCTGSVPRPPETDAELDSYLDIYNFLPQCAITNGKDANPF